MLTGINRAGRRAAEVGECIKRLRFAPHAVRDFRAVHHDGLDVYAVVRRHPHHAGQHRRVLIQREGVRNRGGVGAGRAIAEGQFRQLAADELACVYLAQQIGDFVGQRGLPVRQCQRHPTGLPEHVRNVHGDNALHQHCIFLWQRQPKTLPQPERIQRFARDAREVNALQLHRRGRLTVPLQVALRHALQRICIHNLVAGERPRGNAPRFRVRRVDVFAPQQRGQRYAVKPLPAAIGEHARAEPARVACDAHGADVARQPPFARNFLRQLAQMQLPRQLRLVERPAEVRGQHVQQARQRGVN